MSAAPLPANEAKRLDALRRSKILDSLPELAFEDFTKVAAQIARTPIALVSLVDECRLWFKAKVGIEVSEVPREVGLCAYALESESLLEIPDTLADPRFADNPMVRDEPRVRFYAGAPVRDAEGYTLGTVCIADREPRTLEPAQREALVSLARLVSAHIELRRKSLEFAELHREALVRNVRLRLATELLDLANEMIFVTDAAGRISYWNQGAERAYGIPREEAVGKLSYVLLQTEFPTTREDAIEQLTRDGSWQGEIVHVARDGRRLLVDSRWVLKRDEQGRPQTTLSINRDVTQRREVQQLKDEFVSIVSHELRTPLTSIRGALGLLEGGVVGEIGPDALELVKIARANSDRLIRLVNDILDLEKMEAGKLELHRRELQARTTIESAVQGVAALAKEAGVTVEIEADDDLRLNADEDRIAQLLTNLLSNAIKFSPPDTTVSVRAARRGPRTVRLSVRDQGPGIAADQVNKLFSKFQQLDASDKRQRGGTGLGLSISKAIAEQHGGAIGVDTRMGAGATFWVDLPANAISSARSPAQGPRRLVLLFDPRGALFRSLGALLAQEGCVVARAHDLAEAERWLDSAHPAAVIVDVELPEGHALEIVQALSERFTPADAPTIVLTGRLPNDSRPAAPLPVEWIADPLDETRMKHVLRWGRRDRGTPRVLLVEDDAGFRAVVAARLRHLGVDVLEAEDGESALRIVHENAPDLIVLDIGLPGRDGFDVVAELRKQRARSTPLIVYTARDIGHDERIELSLGITRWLTKSRTDEEQFVHAVRDLLSGLLPPSPPT